MEQEPVYVPSGRLTQVCEEILGKIYAVRQEDKERYVEYRVAQHNQAAEQSNRKRRWFSWCGVKPKMYVTPYGMELIIKAELEAMEPKQAVEHPMCQIHRQYGDLEHETKDAMIQCRMNEAVPVSAGMARGISHLGLSLDFMAKPKFGFYPR